MAGGATQRDSKQNKNTLTLGVDHKLSYSFDQTRDVAIGGLFPTLHQQHHHIHAPIAIENPPKSKMFKNQNTRNKAANSRCLWTSIFYRFLIVIALHIELKATESDTAFFMKRHHPNHIWVAATMWTETI